VGGHQKNTVALAWDNRIVVSSHIGDLSSDRSMQVFEQVVEDLQRLYQIKAEVILCDRHPNYASTRWAKSQQAEVVSIQHHRAHASSLMGRESSAAQQSLVFVWDGAGYGDDGSIWGGETFLGSPANWQRVASLRNFRLPGGEKAAQQPWRSAAALHWQLGLIYDRQHAAPIVYKAWQKDLNCYSTSSVGRLFDAVASMLDLTQISSHEGEAPMLLESLAEKIDTRDCLPFSRVQGMLEIDWAPLLRKMCNGDMSKAYRAGYFHRVMANTVVQVVLDIRKDQTVDNVGFSGGVFQNRLLGELILDQFKALDIEVIQPAGMPVNDGGLSYGQVMEYAASINGNPRNHHA
jgi:hydrogenase maturation protein HypF